MQGSGSNQGRSVTGGYVYRGSIPQLEGYYFFADFVNNRLWSFEFNEVDQADFDGTNFTDFEDWSDRTEIVGSTASVARNISSFGEDNDGNLFVVSLDGNVFRLNSVTTLGDINRDGAVDFLDIPAFISVISDGFQAEADVNTDGSVNFLDIPLFVMLLTGQ